jgi:hypothetical protein
MSFMCPFLDSHLITHHSYIGIPFEISNQIRPNYVTYVGDAWKGVK